MWGKEGLEFNIMRFSELSHCLPKHISHVMELCCGFSLRLSEKGCQGVGWSENGDVIAGLNGI